MEVGVFDEAACCHEADVGLVDAAELGLLSVWSMTHPKCSCLTMKLMDRINRTDISNFQFTLLSSSLSSSLTGA